MEHPPVATGRKRSVTTRPLWWGVVTCLCWLVLPCLLASSGTALAQDCTDTADPEPLADCDDDGWSVSEGDCDDFEFATNPGEDERCGNERDDDCDDDVDEGCDDTRSRAQMEGGSSCERDGSWAGLFLLPLPLLMRRRRR